MRKARDIKAARVNDLLVREQPAVILTAVCDILYIYCIFLNLVQNEITFFYGHPTVLIWCNICFFQKGKPLRHLS